MVITVIPVLFVMIVITVIMLMMGSKALLCTRLCAREIVVTAGIARRVTMAKATAIEITKY